MDGTLSTTKDALGPPLTPKINSQASLRCLWLTLACQVTIPTCRVEVKGSFKDSIYHQCKSHQSEKPILTFQAFICQSFHSRFNFNHILNQELDIYFSPKFLQNMGQIPNLGEQISTYLNDRFFNTSQTHLDLATTLTTILHLRLAYKSYFLLGEFSQFEKLKNS